MVLENKSAEKGVKYLEGIGFRLCWSCWAGDPSWYLENQLILEFDGGTLCSRTARDRIEDTWFSAYQMLLNRGPNWVYMTEGQGFTLECRRDAVSQLLIEVGLTESIRFRGKVEPSDFRKFFNAMMDIIQGRMIPDSKPTKIGRSESWRRPPLDVQDVVEFGPISIGFERVGNEILSFAFFSDIDSIRGQSFLLTLEEWTLLLDRALLQLKLNESSTNHCTSILLGSVEFEIDRDDDTFNAVLVSGTDCHFVLPISTSNPFKCLMELIADLSYRLTDSFG